MFLLIIMCNTVIILINLNITKLVALYLPMDGDSQNLGSHVLARCAMKTGEVYAKK